MKNVPAAEPLALAAEPKIAARFKGIILVRKGHKFRAARVLNRIIEGHLSPIKMHLGQGKKTPNENYTVILSTVKLAAEE